MKLRHSAALIELLSILDDTALADLGLSRAKREDLQDVFEFALDHWREGYGRPHRLENPAKDDDAAMPVLVVIHHDTTIH